MIKNTKTKVHQLLTFFLASQQQSVYTQVESVQASIILLKSTATNKITKKINNQLHQEYIMYSWLHLERIY